MPEKDNQLPWPNMSRGLSQNHVHAPNPSIPDSWLVFSRTHVLDKKGPAETSMFQAFSPPTRTPLLWRLSLGPGPWGSRRGRCSGRSRACCSPSLREAAAPAQPHEKRYISRNPGRSAPVGWLIPVFLTFHPGPDSGHPQSAMQNTSCAIPFATRANGDKIQHMSSVGNPNVSSEDLPIGCMPFASGLLDLWILWGQMLTALKQLAPSLRAIREKAEIEPGQKLGRWRARQKLGSMEP